MKLVGHKTRSVFDRCDIVGGDDLRDAVRRLGTAQTACYTRGAPATMNAQCLPLLCDPDTHAPLQLAGDTLLNPETGARYPIRDGIPAFAEKPAGTNETQQAMYDRLARIYDVNERVFKWFFRKWDIRPQILRELEVPPAARVLEVSVGTGANFSYFRRDVELFGLDVSWGMLRKCARKVKEAGLNAQLFQGEAERLPFRDGIFDSVFCFGAINFFRDQARAVEEMVRVAKPGTRILIVGGTQKAVPTWYKNNPLARWYFLETTKPGVRPIDLVPPAMTGIQLRDVFAGKLYCLTFRKP
jgi:ubiquinone/menaquinone biosynthesis C-methylase UbiE